MRQIKKFFTSYSIFIFSNILIFTFLLSLSFVGKIVFEDFKPIENHISEVEVLVDDIKDTKIEKEILESNLYNSNFDNMSINNYIDLENSALVFEFEKIHTFENYYYINSTNNFFKKGNFIILNNFNVRKIEQVLEGSLILNDNEVASFEDVVGIIVGFKND